MDSVSTTTTPSDRPAGRWLGGWTNEAVAKMVCPAMPVVTAFHVPLNERTGALRDWMLA